MRTEALFDNENYKIKKMQIQEILELEKTNQKALKIKSKRALQVMLNVDEMDWNYTDV